MTEALQTPSAEFLQDAPEGTLPFLKQEEKRWLSLWWTNEQDYLSNKMTPIKGFMQFASQGIKSQDLEDALRACEELVTHYFRRGKVMVDILTPQSAAKVSGEIGSIWEGVKGILPDRILNLVECRLEQPKAEASFDPKQMTWGVAELVRNATQAIGRKEGNWIKVGFKATEDKVVITVADNGWGMSEELVTAICSSPSKLDKKRFTGEVFPGPGFGLAIARTAVENHNGKITFRTRKDEGTVFKITIPR